MIDWKRDALYLIWLAGADLQEKKALMLLERFGSAEAVWKSETRALSQECQLTVKERERLNNRSLAPADTILARCRALSVRVLSILEEDYPARLRQINDPPIVLYVRGTLPDFRTLPAIAVIGKREATLYGMNHAHRVARQLSENGVIVVSGMAKGADAAGHSGALEGPTPTVAVLGTAIDVCYPRENAALHREILAHGAVISEYPPGKEGRASNFVQRNRIISGLSMGVLVAEAGEKSGALITANLAYEQGRDVFAIPGSLDSPGSAGCNNLIADGAKLVRSAADILREYGLPCDIEEKTLRPTRVRTVEDAFRAVTPPEKVEPAEQTEPAPEGEDAKILAALDGVMSAEELAQASGMNPALLGTRLILLELQGKIRQHPGQKYEKIR